MTTIKALKRLSICPCGFGVLDDSIQAGVKYSVMSHLPGMLDHSRGGVDDPSKLEPEPMVFDGATYLCGGCRSFYVRVQVVFCNQITRPDLPKAPLPWGLFSDDPPTLEKSTA